METTANSKEKFTAAWTEEFNEMKKLSWSMGMVDGQEYRNKLEELKAYIEKAANYTFPYSSVATFSNKEVSNV